MRIEKTGRSLKKLTIVPDHSWGRRAISQKLWINTPTKKLTVSLKDSSETLCIEIISKAETRAKSENRYLLCINKVSVIISIPQELDIIS